MSVNGSVSKADFRWIIGGLAGLIFGAISIVYSVASHDHSGLLSREVFELKFEPVAADVKTIKARMEQNSGLAMQQNTSGPPR